MFKEKFDLSDALALADRRERVCKTSPSCPDCKTRQVQLTGYFTDDVGWKCRHCKLRFTTNFYDH